MGDFNLFAAVRVCGVGSFVSGDLEPRDNSVDGDLKVSVVDLCRA